VFDLRERDTMGDAALAVTGPADETGLTRVMRVCRDPVWRRRTFFS
jgi:hypothetical protein